MFHPRTLWYKRKDNHCLCDGNLTLRVPSSCATLKKKLSWRSLSNHYIDERICDMSRIIICIYETFFAIIAMTIYTQIAIPLTRCIHEQRPCANRANWIPICCLLPIVIIWDLCFVLYAIVVYFTYSQIIAINVNARVPYCSRW